MAQLIDQKGSVLGVVPVARRFFEPANDLEVNYLQVLCSVHQGGVWRSVTLTLFNWELADFVRWLRAFSASAAARPYDPNSDFFAFWGRAKGGELHLVVRLSGVRHELVTTRDKLKRFADDLEGELKEFPIITTDDL